MRLRIHRRVRLRDLLCADDGVLCLGRDGRHVAGVGRVVGGVDELRFFPQPLANDVVGRAAVEEPLPAGVVGKVVALEEALQGVVGADAHDQHLASDAAVNALNHAIGPRGSRLGAAMLDAQGAAGALERVGGEATAVDAQRPLRAVGQDVGHREGKGGERLLEKGGGASFRFLILDRQVNHPRGAVYGDV